MYATRPGLEHIVNSSVARTHCEAPRLHSTSPHSYFEGGKVSVGPVWDLLFQSFNNIDMSGSFVGLSPGCLLSQLTFMSGQDGDLLCRGPEFSLSLTVTAYPSQGH